MTSINLNTARRFLTWLLPSGPWSVGAIDPDEASGLAWLTSSELDELTQFLVTQAALGRNLYFQGNMCRPDLDGARASKSDVGVALVVHADVDPPTVPSFIELLDWQSRTAADFAKAAWWNARSLPAPSATIFSGSGFQLLWKLTTPETLWRIGESGVWEPNLEAVDRIEGRNYAMLTAIDPSHAGTHNVDRLLRIPGSRNVPSKLKRQKYGRVDSAMTCVALTDITYSLDVFPHIAPPAAKPRTRRHVHHTVVAGGHIAPSDLRGRLWPGAYEIIRNGAAPEDDRSKIGIRMTCEMIRAGFSDEQIASVLSDPTYGISGHYLDQRDTERAIGRTLSHAHDMIVEDDADNGPRMSPAYAARFDAAVDRWTSRNLQISTLSEPFAEFERVVAQAARATQKEAARKVFK